MILVTGGAGFIGSVLVKELNQMGREDILIVDRLEDSIKWKNLRGLKYLDYIHVDDLFETFFEEFNQKIDFIFHMGACSSTTEMDMDFLMNNNLNYSKNLFLMATSYDIPIIYASSAATYGDGELGYDDEKDIAGLMPLNPYGYSKQLFDEWVLKQEKTPHFWAGMKFFNVYGPNEYHKDSMRSLVSKAFEQIRESGVVRLFKSHKEGYEDGMQLRDFVYVKDIVAAMLLMMNSKSAQQSGIYNMGTGQARSFKDLVLATFKSMGIKPHIDYMDMPDNLRGQYQYYTQATMNKFLKINKDFKFMSIEDGVDDYITKHLMKDNPHY